MYVCIYLHIKCVFVICSATHGARSGHDFDREGTGRQGTQHDCYYYYYHVYYV